jgi:hypothetical protein
MSYKSKETGYKANTCTMSLNDFYYQNEPNNGQIVISENGKLKVIHTVKKRHYDHKNKSITQNIVTNGKFILLESSNRNNYNLLINMSLTYLSESEHSSGNIGKTFAIQLKELFFGMITASSNEVQLYMDCFNKLTKFIKTCYSKYPSDFLSMKQACSKQAPEDMLQVLLINIVLDWNLIDEEQMLQLTLLAINRNYNNIRRQLRQVTPENYNIVLGLPGPLAIIFATIYKSTKDIKRSIEQLMGQVLLQIQQECSGELINDVLNNQSTNYTNSNKQKSLKIIKILLSYIELETKPTPEQVFEICINNIKIQEKIYFTGEPLPRGFISTILQCNGRSLDERTSIIEPKNLKDWSAIVINTEYSVGTKQNIVIYGIPRASDTNGDTKAETNFRISDATQNITNPGPKSNRQNEGAISGRGILFSRFQYINKGRIAKSLKNLDVNQEIVQITVTIGDANKVTIKMENGEFEMDTYFRNCRRIMIAFKSITNIKIEHSVEKPMCKSLPQEQMNDSIASIISGFASQAFLTPIRSTNVEPILPCVEPTTPAVSHKEPFDEYLCPITKELMNEPVTAVDGFTYEKNAIEEWFSNSQNSPKTGEMLDSINLIPNRTLQNLIVEYKDTYNIGVNLFEELPYN